MADKELDEALYALRARVDALENEYPELREQLEPLLARLEHRVAAESHANPLHLLGDMKDGLTRLEVEHPTATGVIQELMLVLSNLGI